MQTTLEKQKWLFSLQPVRRVFRKERQSLSFARNFAFQQVMCHPDLTEGKKPCSSAATAEGLKLIRTTY
ncbi:hypothetical protein [Paraburkholderia sediminicola]|uniref:hypothetical protein n=1 Tax=Paraburkholderia sediminicola TaxID=458836 RepID=UPI0038BC8309